MNRLNKASKAHICLSESQFEVIIVIRETIINWMVNRAIPKYLGIIPQ